MTNEQTPEDAPMTGAEPPAAPVPGSDTPTTVTPPPPPSLAALANQAAAGPPPAPAPAPMAAPIAAPMAAPMVPPPTAPTAPVSAQPPVAWQAAPPPAVAVKGRRTALAAIAGILLLLGGIGGILLGLLIAVLGSTVIGSLGGQFGNIPELNGADPAAVFAGVIAFFGLIIVAYSVAYLLAGIGVLRNSNWARILGLVVGIISGLIWLSGLTNANQIPDASSARGSLLFSVIALGIHVYIVVALLFFWRTKPSAAS
jgi:hypothetical protein